MRRGVGVARVQTDKAAQKQMQELGHHLEAMKVSQLADHMALLERRLSELAHKHQAQIRKDPMLRAKFKQLSDELGIDMLTTKNNVWARTLKLGDYYYDLCVRIVDLCMHEKRFTGGIVPMNYILSVLQKKRPEDNVRESDVLIALDKLKVLSNGYHVVTVGQGTKYVVSTADELSTDSAELLRIADTRQSPSLSLSEAVKELRWSAVRAEKALNSLLNDGVAWVDSPSSDFPARSPPSCPPSCPPAPQEEVRYWFIALLQQ